MIRRLLYKNLKFVYRISQWNKHRLTPAGLLIAGGMIAAGIFGVDVRQSLAFYVFSITASLLLVSTLGILSFRGQFKITRLLPQFGTVNQPMRYQIQIENLGKIKQSDLLIIDELETSLPEYDEFKGSQDPQDKHRNRFDRVIGYPRLMALIRNKRGGTVQPMPVGGIGAAAQVELAMELVPLRRGYIHFSSARLCCTDPLGLVRAMKKYKQRNKLLILPKTYRTPKIELKGLRKYQRGGMNQASAVGDSQEFMSLRDYQPGDPMRAIHWRSYAKTGHPVVKEFHDEFFVRQGLVLDTFQENMPTKVFEEAISVAASFCLTLPGQDALLDLMFIGDKAYRYTSGRGLGQSESLLETLACVKACAGDSFDKLRNLIPEFSTETSGMICVLLNWDSKRKNLVESIILSGIPVVVFVIVDDTNKADLEPGPLAQHPERLISLSCDHIQEDLNDVGKFSLSKE